MRVRKAGVKSRLVQTPKSECFTSSHVEYFMSEQAGEGNAATKTKITHRSETGHILRKYVNKSSYLIEEIINT
jgi:hypothetical protein